MPAELFDALRDAVQKEGIPLKLVDPVTGEAYLLVREIEFDSLADTYGAQVESAMRAGWNDPAMDEYNDYDRHRKQ